MKRQLFAFFLIAVLLLSGCAAETEKDSSKKDSKPSAEQTEQEAIYQNAIDLLDAGKTEDAYKEFLSIPDYEDVSAYLADFSFLPIAETRTLYGLEEDQSEVQNTTYSYDAKGSLIRYGGGIAGGPEFEVSYEYDDQGRVIREEALAEAGESVITYEYDEQGRLSRRVGVTHGPDLGGITLFTYDSEGRVELVTQSSYMGTEPKAFTEPYHVSKRIYEYGAEGTIGKIYEEYGDAIQYTYTFAYNEKKQPTEIICLDQDAKITKTKLTYDAQGRCTAAESDFGSYIYSYDEAGNLIKETCVQGEYLSHTAEYTYRAFYQPNPNSTVPHPLDTHLSILNPYFG